MKKWKKSGRKRNKNKTLMVDLKFYPEEYFKINEYRIKNGYSWTKLANVALKEAVKLHKERNEVV
jgi:hypothetical protein